MISSYDLQTFLDYCDSIHDSLNNYLLGKDTPEWSEDRRKNYSSGIVPGLCREKNELLEKIIKEGCNEEELRPVIEEWCKSCNVEMDSQSSGKPSFMPGEDLSQWIKNHCQDIIEDVKGRKNEEILAYLYLYYQYKIHCIINENAIELEQPNITKLYKDHKSPAYDDHYGLIYIGGSISLHIMNPPRIYDEYNNKTINLITSRSVVNILNKLFEDKLIGSLEFRGKDDSITDGFSKWEFLNEEIERGDKFSLNINKLPEVSKFYTSLEYDDQFWVKKTERDLTFEELRKEPKLNELDDDKVYTQVIHLEYGSDNNQEYYISHMDHEYIVYTRDEYNHRKTNIIKGDAHKPIKTFKLDKAKIPFDYLCEVKMENDQTMYVPFIYYILDRYFINKSLLEEYFEKTLDK